MKKLFNIALAGAMALSMTSIAFAADEANQMTVTGELNVPTIKVTVPQNGSVMVNPYRLSVEVGGEELTDGVLSANYGLVSETEVALDVAVKGLLTVPEGSGIKIAAAPLADLAAGTKAKNKEVFVYLAFSGDSITTDEDDKGTTIYKGTLPTYDESAEATNKGILVLSNKEAKDATVLGSIPAATLQDDGSVNEGDEGLAAFRFCGEAYAETVDPWTEADTVNATLVFSFAPQVNPDSTSPYTPAG